MSERKALEMIAEQLQGIRYEELSVAEKNILRFALDALNWQYKLNSDGDVVLVYRY
jgi:hypothetical protein